MRRPLPLLCLLLGAAAAAAAPKPEAAPATPVAAAREALRRSHAGLHRFVLENGLIGLVMEDRSAPVAAVQVWVGTGAIHQEHLLGSGISHAFEHMIFKGTPTRGPADITREINDAGGDINAYTSFDRTVFHTDLPSANWRTGLAVLADAVVNGTYPEDEWKKEKEVILREIAMNRDDPDREVGNLLWRTAFAVHPYRHPVIGYADLVQAVTRQDLVDFARRHYVTDNMIVVAVGAVPAAELEQGVREVFGAFPRRPRAPVVLPAEPPQLAPRQARQTGPYSVSRLELAYHTVPLAHPDAAALDVLAQVVGEGRSSRLVNRIRERRGLAHQISAWSYTPRDPGLFGVSAAFEPAKEAELLAALREEMAAWRETPFAEEEVAKAKRMILAETLSEVETMKGQADSFASGEFFAGTPAFSEVYLERLDRVTAADLQAVARRYLREENETLALLSPAGGAPAGAAAAGEPAAAAFSRLELGGGVPVIVREDHRVPFVYFCAAARGGLLAEEERTVGLTRLMAELLVKGTGKRTREQIAEAVESMGASLSPFSGYNTFGLQGRCLSADAPLLADLFADCLLNAAFPENEVKLQKDLQMAAIDEQREKPFILAQQGLMGLLFPDHPYRWHPLGTRETVGGIDRAAIEAHRRRLLVPGNLVVAVFGDITPAQARGLLEARLRLAAGAGAPKLGGRPAGARLPARARREEPKEQAIILMGVPGVDVGDPRAEALNVLQEALSGLSADLGLAVREQRGLAYYVGAYQQLGLDPGAFALYAGTRPDALAEVEGLMSNEVVRVAEGGLRPDEFERARRRLAADHEMKLQSNGETAMLCALDELYGLGYEHTLTRPERLAKLTVEDVRRAAASVLKRDRLAVSILLPRAGAPAEAGGAAGAGP